MPLSQSSLIQARNQALAKKQTKKRGGKEKRTKEVSSNLLNMLL